MAVRGTMPAIPGQRRGQTLSAAKAGGPRANERGKQGIARRSMFARPNRRVVDAYVRRPGFGLFASFMPEDHSQPVRSNSGLSQPVLLEDFMRRTIAAVSATGALLFGGAGIANAAVESSPVPSSTTTSVAQTDNNQNQKSDKTGLWGLLGLLGLGGLAGLRGRRETHAGTGTAGPGPRA